MLFKIYKIVSYFGQAKYQYISIYLHSEVLKSKDNLLNMYSNLTHLKGWVYFYFYKCFVKFYDNISKVNYLIYTCSPTFSAINLKDWVYF